MDETEMDMLAEKLAQAKARVGGKSSLTTDDGKGVRGDVLKKMKYGTPDAGGLDFDVRQEPYICQRCDNEFTQATLYALEPNPDDLEGEPVARLWGGENVEPEHCPACVAALKEEAERREEARLRAERMDVNNPVYINRLKNAGIYEQKLWRATLRNFDRSVPDGLSGEALKQAERAARAAQEGYDAARSFVEGVMSGNLGERPWRFFNGPTGTGKTHLAIGVDRALFVLGFKGRVALIVAPLFLDNVRAGYSDRTADALIRSVLDADVVIVDDLGRGQQSEDRASKMNELGCALAGKPVVFSGNYTRQGLVQRNAEFMTLASRLGPASCWTVELLDRDRRDDAPKNNE